MTSPWSNQPPAPGTVASQYGYNNSFAQSAPAYHSAQVRQTFTGQPFNVNYAQPPMSAQTSQHSSLSPSPALGTETKKTVWPASVKEYVQRAFQSGNDIEGVTAAEMQVKLKETITHAAECGQLESRDWAAYPLPQNLIQQEKRSKAEVAWKQDSMAFHLATTGAANGHANGGKEPLSRKRKSQELGNGLDASSGSPPWRNTTNNTRMKVEDLKLEDRITGRQEKRQQPLQDTSPKGTSKFQKAQEKRQKRFDGGYKSSYKKADPEPLPMSGPVIGTSQDLEKNYFRLTDTPKPSQIRPENILRQTLELLKKKWKKDGNYNYICDQFKSMRQDLTVQRIKNDFTVNVYEIHARIALEKGDLGEYNQCQTQLRALYAQKAGGNPVEFKAYRILYFIHTANRTALNDVLADLTAAEKDQEAIKHALNVRSSLALGNYHNFFRLYLDVPNMGAYLMDMFVVRERLAALSHICRAYKQDVRLRFVTEELGFESDSESAEFIVEYKGEHLLVEKGAEGDRALYILTAQAGNLFELAKTQANAAIDIKGQI